MPRVYAQTSTHTFTHTPGLVKQKAALVWRVEFSVFCDEPVVQLDVAPLGRQLRVFLKLVLIDPALVYIVAPAHGKRRRQVGERQDSARQRAHALAPCLMGPLVAGLWCAEFFLPAVSRLLAPFALPPPVAAAGLAALLAFIMPIISSSHGDRAPVRAQPRRAKCARAWDARMCESGTRGRHARTRRRVSCQSERTEPCREVLGTLTGPFLPGRHLPPGNRRRGLRRRLPQLK